MKRIVLFLATGLVFTALNAQTANEAVKFETETHDFGKIKQGVPVKYDFVFKNISKAPVTVETATATCGCTTPEWPKAPVMPGRSEKINAGFNAAAPGRFEKTITVKLQGIESTVMLKIMGEVVTGDGVEAATPQLVETSDKPAAAVTVAPVKSAPVAKTVAAKRIAKAPRKTSK